MRSSVPASFAHKSYGGQAQRRSAVETRSPRRLIRLRINPELHHLIRLEAATCGVTQAEVIRRSIRKDLVECAQKGEQQWPVLSKTTSNG